MKDNLVDGVSTGNSKRFIILVIFIILSIIFLITTIIFIILYKNAKNESNNENTTPEKNDVPFFPPSERFVKVLTKITESEGALIKQGKHDILNSKYFNFVDVYNMKSSGSLILLEKFKTYQQTSEITCGPASLIMAINYLDGTILDEAEVEELCRTAKDGRGTKTYNLEKAITALGYTFDSKNNYTEEDNPTNNSLAFSKYIQESLRNNESIIVASNDWGGHYSVIIGYDDMGTEDYTEDDIIILADPYDTTDHMSDGYTIFSFERFYSQMSIRVFGIPDQDYNFIRLKRKN